MAVSTSLGSTSGKKIIKSANLIGTTSNVSIPRAAAPIQPLNYEEKIPVIDVPEKLLLRWNAAMMFFHTILAIVTLALGKIDLQVDIYKTDYSFEVYVNDSWRPAFNQSNADGFRLLPFYKQVEGLYITALTASFFFISALFHFLNVSLLRTFYISKLKNCYTPTRWIEYFFSAPVMFALIAYGLGIRDQYLLAATSALIAVTMPFGAWVESISRPKMLRNGEIVWNEPFWYRISPWFVGHIPQVVAWALVYISFYSSSWDLGRIPWFVFLILWGECILFFSFGAASFLSQYYPPPQFWKGELLFQILSLVSKGFLGILLIVNVLMLSSFDEIYENV